LRLVRSVGDKLCIFILLYSFLFIVSPGSRSLLIKVKFEKKGVVVDEDWEKRKFPILQKIHGMLNIEDLQRQVAELVIQIKSSIKFNITEIPA